MFGYFSSIVNIKAKQLVNISIQRHTIWEANVGREKSFLKLCYRRRHTGASAINRNYVALLQRYYSVIWF